METNLNICPKCNSSLAIKPGIRINKEGSLKQIRTFSLYCPNCKFESEKFQETKDAPWGQKYV